MTTAFTDAVYVQFNAAVSARRRYAAATWSSVWYLLAAFAVISYTSNWAYVLFAALGSWIGGFLSIIALELAAAPAPITEARRAARDRAAPSLGAPLVGQPAQESSAPRRASSARPPNPASIIAQVEGSEVGNADANTLGRPMHPPSHRSTC